MAAMFSSAPWQYAGVLREAGPSPWQRRRQTGRRRLALGACKAIVTCAGGTSGAVIFSFRCLAACSSLPGPCAPAPRPSLPGRRRHEEVLPGDQG